MFYSKTVRKPVVFQIFS